MASKSLIPLCFLILFICSFPGADAGDGSRIYWINSSGAASWSTCESSTDPGSNYCALNTANINAQAGDTVYLKGGTYTISGNYVAAIEPAHSGTSISNRITYSNAPGETPILTKGTGTDINGLRLEGKNYTKIQGLTFSNFNRWAMITHYSSYNEVANSTFRSDTGDEGIIGFMMYDICSGGSAMGCYVTHNWIHDNVFSKAHGGASACLEGADLVRIGGPPTTGLGGIQNGENNYNTIENNYMEYAGHAILDTYGRFLVIRNNVMHNEAWIPDYSGGTCAFPPMPNGKYGHRIMQTSEDYGRDGTYVLTEGNRLGYASANPGNGGDANYALAAPKNIVRYNYMYGSAIDGLYFKYKTNGTPGAGGMGSTDNRVYSNTMFHNGYGYPYLMSSQPGCTVCPGDQAGISIFGLTSKNIIKNNIAYDSYSTILYNNRDIIMRGGADPALYPGTVTVVNNWVTSNGDPKFVNPDISQPASKTLPDLSLQPSSPAIDKGTYLTQANGSGSSSTTLIVQDALYFQDGSWGSDLARSNLHADWIAIGAVTSVVQISSINYSTNTITLASPMTWSDNAPVWLYKKSDREVVLYGSAPDIGAYEHQIYLSQSCTELGDCCSPGQVCSTGYFNPSTDCSSCCVGGTCRTPVCGDIHCDPGETCSCSECACSSGICCSGSCQTPACSQASDCGSNPCLTYTCSNPGSCSASCSSVPKTSCTNGDGCCPAGCTSQNDADCNLCSGLVLLHHYDNNPTYGESATKAYDFSRNGNNGTTQYNAFISTTAGKFSGAAQFDGDGDYILVPNNPTLNFGSNIEFAISAWVKTNGTDTQQILLSKRGSAGWMTWLDSNPRFRIDEGANLVDTTFSYPFDNNWHHIVAMRNSTYHSVWVDGIIRGITADNTLADLTDPTYLAIGNDIGYAPSAITGSIDELAIWNRSLSSQEIQNLYSSGSPISCQTCVHKSDNNPCDGKVCMAELLAFIDRWKYNNQDVTIRELIAAIGLYNINKGC